MGRLGISEIFILIIIFAGITAYFVSRNSSSTKSSSIAYLLWFLSFFGVLGFHRFYLGKIGTGLLWLFTGGVFGFGAFIDLFTLGNQVTQYNTNEELKEIRTATLSNAQSINQSKSINEKVLNLSYVETGNKNSNIEPHQDKIEKLKDIKKLLDDGILTQEEFEQQKTKILG
ncbi:NINE protein [Flavobacterium sp.]|uniref:NINE protein n=1 Tax=Flavobacterium sp. TaxID=239 RepID=UPI003752102D